jgi:hypothetical protein
MNFLSSLGEPHPKITEAESLVGFITFEHLHITRAAFGEAVNRRQDAHRDLSRHSADIALCIV